MEILLQELLHCFLCENIIPHYKGQICNKKLCSNATLQDKIAWNTVEYNIGEYNIVYPVSDMAPDILMSCTGAPAASTLQHTLASRAVCLVCIEHCTLHTAHCTLHTGHCILHTSHCTLYQCPIPQTRPSWEHWVPSSTLPVFSARPGLGYGTLILYHSRHFLIILVVQWPVEN